MFSDLTSEQVQRVAHAHACYEQKIGCMVCYVGIGSGGHFSWCWVGKFLDEFIAQAL